MRQELLERLGKTWGERPTAQAETGTQTNRFLVVTVSQQEMLLPVESVREIISAPRLTALPRSRAEILGVTSLRGEIIPVLCLTRILGGQVNGKPEFGRCLILNSDGESVGLRVDDVQEFAQIRPDDGGMMTSDTLAEEFRVISSVALEGDVVRPVLDVALILAVVFGEGEFHENESH